jgi:hypothetical protein
MSDDPLGKFARKFVQPRTAISGPARPSAPQPAPDYREPSAPGLPQAYEAFEAKDRVLCLEIRCRSGIHYTIPYAYMRATIFHHRTGAELFFSGAGLAVTIRGRSLHPVAQAIRLHTCDFVQEFDPEEFVIPQPEDRGAPFVEAIAVEVRGAAEEE